MLTRPPLPPRLAPLPDPVFPDPRWRPGQLSRFLSTAYLSVAETRWPGAPTRRWESWFRSPQGHFLCGASSRLLAGLRVEPQAWLGFAAISGAASRAPVAPDILLAEDYITRRLSAFRTWRTPDRFKLSCHVLGGPWEVAHTALLRVRGRYQAVEAEIRGEAVAGRTGDAVVSAVVAKHLPDWEALYSRIEAKAAALESQARERACTGEFIWVPLLK